MHTHIVTRQTSVCHLTLEVAGRLFVCEFVSLVYVFTFLFVAEQSTTPIVPATTQEEGNFIHYSLNLYTPIYE
mgnify:CR=1 FL=1